MSQTPAAGFPEIPGYRDLVRIGRGGFATVYLAREIAFERNVAIKVLDARDLADDARQRFERECRAIGSLSDQAGIVTVHTAGTTPEGRPYLVMEYVAGGTLGARIKQTGPIPPDEVARLGVDLLAAIESAHGLGIVHRDIKPDNILLMPDGRPVLGDFGISSMPGSYETGTGSSAATVGFAAPEIIDGARASVASDLYSLGATLGSALIGRPLFSGGPEESLIAQINRILREDPPDLTAFGASHELDGVLRRALAKDPADRYASAAAFRDALQQVASAGLPGMPGVVGSAHVATNAVDEVQAATLLRSDLPRAMAPVPTEVLSESTLLRVPHPPAGVPAGPPASAPAGPPASAPAGPPAVPVASPRRPRRKTWWWVGVAAALAVIGGAAGVALAAGGESRDTEPVVGSVDPTTPPPEPVPDPVVVVQRVLDVRAGVLELTAALKGAEHCDGGRYRLQIRKGSWIDVRQVKLSAQRKTIDLAPGRYRMVSAAVEANGFSCPTVRSKPVDVTAPAPAPRPAPQPAPRPAPKPAPKPTLKDPVKPG